MNILSICIKKRKKRKNVFLFVKWFVVWYCMSALFDLFEGTGIIYDDSHNWHNSQFYLYELRARQSETQLFFFIHYLNLFCNIDIQNLETRKYKLEFNYRMWAYTQYTYHSTFSNIIPLTYFRCQCMTPWPSKKKHKKSWQWTSRKLR